ncbi:hypothetical protein ACVDG9_18325 [Roseibium sp. RP-7]
MNADIREYLIKRDDGPDLRFQGELIASVESSQDRQSRLYSGQTGNWDELELYRTAAGNFVCVIENCTAWAGERNTRQAAVVSDAAGVIEFFGQEWLAKLIYSEAGLANVQDVA